MQEGITVSGGWVFVQFSGWHTDRVAAQKFGVEDRIELLFDGNYCIMTAENRIISSESKGV